MRAKDLKERNKKHDQLTYKIRYFDTKQPILLNIYIHLLIFSLHPYLVVNHHLADREHCSSLNLDYSHMQFLVRMAHDCQRDLH